jgi:Protein of unknown function (DUF1353)
MPGFPADTVVDVEQIGERNWRLLREITYQGSREPFVAPVDMETDFASVPRFFVWCIPRYGRYTKAAIIHDHLWRDQVAKGNISLRDADGLFRQAMRELGVPFLRRWMMWAAVRWAAAKKGGLTKDWWIEFPRLLLLTIVVLPIVAPPAIVILLAVLLLYVVERIAWLLLLLGKVLGRPLHVERREKQVNAPSLSFKL